MRIRSEKALIEAIRQMRDYLRDGGFHAPLTKWHWVKARRVLEVEASSRWGWKLRKRWTQQLREVGLDPESLHVVDQFRWSVALDLFYDPAFEKTFPIDEFKRRLTLARAAADELVRDYSDYEQTESAPEEGSRRVALERFGIEID